MFLKPTSTALAWSAMGEGRPH